MNSNNKNWLWISLICLTIALGQLQRLEVGGRVAVYVHELLMVIWLMVVWLRRPQLISQVIKQSWLFLKTHRLLLIWAAWILVGWVQATLTNSLPLTTWLYAARICFYLIFWLAIWHQLKIKELAVSSLHTSLLISGSLVVWFGLLQYLVVPDIRSLAILGWDDHYYRLVSTFFDPAFTGMTLVLTLALGLFWNTHRYLKLGWMWLVMLAIALTYSRASYLSLGILISLVTIWPQVKLARSVKYAVLIALSAFLALFLIPTRGGEGVKLARTSSIQARATSITQGLSSLEGYEWLTGKGLLNSLSARPSASQIPYHATLPDNSVLLILGGTGLIGSLLTLVLLAQLYRYLWRSQPRLIPILTAVLIHSLFSATLTQPLVMFYFGGVWLVTAKSKT